MIMFSTVVLGYGWVEMFSDVLRRIIRIHKAWRSMVLLHNMVDHMSSLRREVSIRWERVFPGKHGMMDLMFDIK